MSNLITAVFTLGFILALALLGYHAVAWVGGAYSDLEADIAALLVVASTVLLLCSLIVASALRSLGQERSETRRWLAKAETYELCLELLQRPGREADAEKHRLAERRLALYAGQNVLQHYRVMHKKASASGPACSDEARDRLPLAMRRDLGGATLGLGKGVLLSLLIPAAGQRLHEMAAQIQDPDGPNPPEDPP